MKYVTYVSVSWHWYINKTDRKDELINEWMNDEWTMKPLYLYLGTSMWTRMIGWMNDEWMNDEWKMKPMYLYLDTGI